MRRTLPIAVTVLALAIGGCGDDGQSSGADAPARSGPPPYVVRPGDADHAFAWCQSFSSEHPAYGDLVAATPTNIAVAKKRAADDGQATPWRTSSDERLVGQCTFSGQDPARQVFVDDTGAFVEVRPGP